MGSSPGEIVPHNSSHRALSYKSGFISQSAITKFLEIKLPSSIDLNMNFEVIEKNRLLNSASQTNSSFQQNSQEALN